jgi:hypothetical protein
MQRPCRGAAGPNQLGRVVLLLRQCVEASGDLHRRTQFVGEEGIAPPAYECHVKEERTAKRVAQEFGALVTNSGLRHPQSVAMELVARTSQLCLLSFNAQRSKQLRTGIAG